MSRTRQRLQQPGRLELRARHRVVGISARHTDCAFMRLSESVRHDATTYESIRIDE